MAEQEVVKESFEGLELTFGPMKIGFMKRNAEKLRKITAGGVTFADVPDMMGIVYHSVKNGMPDNYPGDDALDEAMDLLSYNRALMNCLRASGFKVEVLSPGEAGPPKE